MSATPSWPRSAAEWRAAFAAGLGLSPADGARRLRDGTLPHDDIEAFLKDAYAQERGYHPDFVPALLRNRDGLIAWVYGDGAEPNWPGSDAGARGSQQ